MSVHASTAVRFALTLIAAAVLVGSSDASADDRAAAIAANRDALDAYFARHVRQIADDSALVDLTSADAWQQRRATYRQQLADMLGLHPMPQRTPLNAEITGTLEHEAFTVEKLHFQSLPGLYVTANLYIPKNLPDDQPAPTVLYLCGHAQRVVDGVSLGNKTAYQHHPAWFARHGYVCLVVDTIQLGEIQGLHHGTHREGMFWWNSRGYTPAGVEAFNAMRALDYLETRPEVDADRIGVTGRSGGGIGTLYLAALDDRVAVAAPVSGITDLHNHIRDHLTPRHCDCNYFPNVHQFDYARIVALIAPRPLLILNADKDPIFPLDGIQRVHRQVRHIYELHDASANLGLTITEGPHRDTQPLRVPVFAWFNRHLKGEEPLIDQPAVKLFDDAELRVFDDLPGEQIVTEIHHSFVPTVEVDPPATVGEWKAQRDRFREKLDEVTFRNWPSVSPALSPSRAFAAEREGVSFEAWDYTVEPHVQLRLYVASTTEDPRGVTLFVLDDAGWERFLAAARTTFADELADELAMYGDVEADSEHAEALRDMMRGSGHAFAFLAPRGIGLTRWSDDASDAVHLRRRFPIVGQTLDSRRVFDVTRTLEGIRDRADELPITLHASGEAAGIALYAAVLDQQVDTLVLEDLPTTHHEGVELLQVMRFMDIPQAVAVALENTTIRLRGADADAWPYPRHVAEILDRGEQLHFSR